MKKTNSQDMTFDGMTNGNKGGYNSKYQHKAAGIPSAKANYGRGPTKVGSGSTGVSGKQPAKTATGREQKRNPSGTKERECCMKGNYGRGPTKGVAQ